MLLDVFLGVPISEIMDIEQPQGERESERERFIWDYLHYTYIPQIVYP